MKTAKDIALTGVYTALLIGAQVALSALSGIEVVTVLLLSFCYCFGIARGLAVANSFSLLRCLVFGFFPSVLILYLVYYNIFAVVSGLLGRKFKGEVKAKELAFTLFAAVLMTVFFPVLDDIITPLYYGYTVKEAKAYAVASVAAVIPQTVCVIITVTAVFPVLCNVFRRNFTSRLLR